MKESIKDMATWLGAMVCACAIIGLGPVLVELLLKVVNG